MTLLHRFGKIACNLKFEIPIEWRDAQDVLEVIIEILGTLMLKQAFMKPKTRMRVHGKQKESILQLNVTFHTSCRMDNKAQ
jgi:hypothetical protein